MNKRKYQIVFSVEADSDDKIADFADHVVRSPIAVVHRQVDVFPVSGFDSEQGDRERALFLTKFAYSLFEQTGVIHDDEKLDNALRALGELLVMMRDDSQITERDAALIIRRGEHAPQWKVRCASLGIDDDSVCAETLEEAVVRAFLDRRLDDAFATDVVVSRDGDLETVGVGSMRTGMKKVAVLVWALSEPDRPRNREEFRRMATAHLQQQS